MLNFVSMGWILRLTGLKISGTVDTHIFSGKKYNFMHFERHFAFQTAYNLSFFFPENLKKFLGFTSKFR